MNTRPARRLLGAAATALLLVTATILAQTPARQVPYENMKVDVQGLRVTLTYDLVAIDPANEVFTVSLEVRLKSNGQLVPVNPANLSGDGLGARLTAGPQKRIVWNAGQDLEIPQFDLYDLNLIVVSIPGQLVVTTTPLGAAVTIDGEPQPRGVTPLTLAGLRPGMHAVVVARDGYIENSHQELVEAGKTTTVTRTLTVAPKTPQGVGGSKGGGIPKWLIPVAGGGAAAALLGLKGKGTTNSGNSNAVCTSFNISSTSFSPAQGGESKPVTVTGAQPSGCTSGQWSAAVDNAASTPYIHVSPSSGTPGQSTTVTVDANAPDLNANNRGGSVTIGGNTFTVSPQSNAITTGPVQVLPSAASGSATFLAVPGVTVVSGQTLKITASGTILVIVAGVPTQVQPVGLGPPSAGSAGRLPGQPRFGLICFIGDQSLGSVGYFVGTSLTVTATDSGALYCGTNAPDPSGFIGTSQSWTVTVTVGGSG